MNKQQDLKDTKKILIKKKIGIFFKIDGKCCIPYNLKREKINNRSEFGYWEADLIVSRRQSGYYHLLTLVEKTWLSIIRKKVKMLDQWRI